MAVTCKFHNLSRLNKAACYRGVICFCHTTVTPGTCQEPARPRRR
ncbi:hypothetical protein D083_0091 [Dickeya solani RNS 08.23.3.1.A]|nr:hypothetical protein D083_0091 [Dickeya solani RNS 08.23.3.1.A]